MSNDTSMGCRRRTRHRVDTAMVIILGLSTCLYLPCQGLPAYNHQKLQWRNNGLALANPWNLMPVSDTQAENYILEEDTEMTRPQTIRQRDIDSAELWRQVPYISETETKAVLPVINPVGSRLEKKDVFVSREWGAGGMPFSVLYMSPRPRHAPPAGSMTHAEESKSTDVSRTPEIPASSLSAHSNYRVAVRNGGSSQMRRQYSMIPQLFMSYGWGPTGK